MKTRLRHSGNIEIRRSELHGWGVFAIRAIRVGETLEEVPFYKLGMESPAMESVRYYWPRSEPWDCMAVPAGFAMLYNHSTEANADWETLDSELLFRFFTLRDIESGDEILIDYGVNYPW